MQAAYIYVRVLPEVRAVSNWVIGWIVGLVLGLVFVVCIVRGGRREDKDVHNERRGGDSKREGEKDDGKCKYTRCQGVDGRRKRVIQARRRLLGIGGMRFKYELMKALMQAGSRSEKEAVRYYARMTRQEKARVNTLFRILCGRSLMNIIKYSITMKDIVREEVSREGKTVEGDGSKDA